MVADEILNLGFVTPNTHYCQLRYKSYRQMRMWFSEVLGNMNMIAKNQLNEIREKSNSLY